jgi:uncharacterized protein DUF3306
MSDEEFLARWSRRKREAKVAAEAPPPTEPAEASSPAPSGTAENPADAEVDLSGLPPIESIEAATDITAFLRKGIPPALSRAALRRAWAADPAIRDFIGLAENSWDFNDPHAMPGFGPLDCSEAELGELVDRIVGGARRVADHLATGATKADVVRSLDPEQDPQAESQSAVATADAVTAGSSAPAPAAVQPASSNGNDSDQIVVRRRRHGSALPS